MTKAHTHPDYMDPAATEANPTVPHVSRKAIARTLQNFSAGDPETCWEWQGSIDNGKYPVLWADSQGYRATHLVYQMYYKDQIASDEQIVHTCRNPQCVNPFHLWKVLKSDFRSAGWEQEYEADQKLSRMQVREIKNLITLSRLPYSSIAKMYQVDDSYISRIARGKAWGHIQRRVL